MTDFEWGVIFPSRDMELHRGPWTEEQARAWIREADEDGFIGGAFQLVRREVGPWETP